MASGLLPEFKPLDKMNQYQNPAVGKMTVSSMNISNIQWLVQTMRKKIREEVIWIPGFRDQW
jgi:hypothetical protein